MNANNVENKIEAAIKAALEEAVNTEKAIADLLKKASELELKANQAKSVYGIDISDVVASVEEMRAEAARLAESNAMKVLAKHRERLAEEERARKERQEALKKNYVALKKTAFGQFGYIEAISRSIPSVSNITVSAKKDEFIARGVLEFLRKNGLPEISSEAIREIVADVRKHRKNRWQKSHPEANEQELLFSRDPRYGDEDFGTLGEEEAAVVMG